MRIFSNEKGFTLVEILMVILLVGILAAVSIPQFIDFRTDAKNAAAQSALGTLRTAIVNQYANMNLRCNSNTFPTAAQIAANDVTTGGTPCTATQVAAPDRAFVAGGVIPDNPWGGASPKNSVVACSGANGCDKTDATNCAGNAYSSTDTGWCYDPAKGQIWANSRNNGSTTAPESSF